MAYTRGEVVWLLSLTRDQAIALDASQRDSCAGLADTNEGGGPSAEPPDVPTIARWVDVQRAKRHVIRGKEGLAILQLRAGGFSERELARLTGGKRLTLRRRWHATIEEILGHLGDSEPELVLSHVDLCIRCGLYPRVYLEPVRVRVRGGFKIAQRGRQASVCANCLSPMLAPRILGGLPEAA